MMAHLKSSLIDLDILAVYRTDNKAEMMKEFQNQCYECGLEYEMEEWPKESEDFNCSSCRERSKREDTIIFKRFPNFRPPTDSKELLSAWGYNENGDTVL